MYQFYQNTLAIPARALYEDLEVMSKANYDKQCRLGKMNRLRMGKGLDNCALIEFDSMPERFRTEIVRKIGIPPKKTEQNLLLNQYKTDYEAQHFFALHEIEDNRTLSLDKQEEYVINAQMLNALDVYLKNQISFIKARNGRRNLTDLWNDAASAIFDLKDHVGHNLPKSARRLKEKLEDYQEKGYISLIPDTYGNANSTKVKDNQQEALLRQLFRKHQGLDNVEIATHYNVVADAFGWDKLSPSSIANYRKKWNVSVVSFTKGLKDFDNTMKMQIKRKAPEHPLAYWTLDGWKAELLYQKEGTYHNRLTIVVVLDAATKYPVGYAIGEQENTELIKAALRDAVNHTEALFGFKHKVYQVQADNYGTKVMTPIYKGVAVNYRPTKVGNAKAKIIEPWFNFFNKTYCKLQSNWSGFGIKSKQQPNQDWLQKNRKNFPDEAQAYSQLEMLIEKARADGQEKFVEKYHNAPDDLKIELSDFEFLKHLGVKKPQTTKYRGQGIVFDIQKKEYTYDCFQLEFRQHTHIDWSIKFDPQNMNKVLAYNEDKNLAFELEEKYIQPMDLYSQEKEDRNQLQKVSTFNRQLVANIMKEYAEDAETVDSIVFNNKEIGETLEKLIITDDLGRHKDQKNMQTKKAIQKKAEKVKEKIQKIAVLDEIQEQDDYFKQKININKYLEND